LDVVTSTS